MVSGWSLLTKARQHFADGRAKHFVHEIVERCRLGVHDHHSRARVLGRRNHVGHRIDLQARADGQQDVDLYKRIQIAPLVNFDSLSDVVVLVPVARAK